jgi:hypothetical protein
MFVRIKKRPVKLMTNRVLDYSYRFVIVESYRKDSKPRQRIIGYLGSIRASKLKRANERHIFVQQMQKKMTTFGFSPRVVSMLSLSLIRCVVHGGADSVIR